MAFPKVFLQAAGFVACSAALCSQSLCAAVPEETLPGDAHAAPSKLPAAGVAELELAGVKTMTKRIKGTVFVAPEPYAFTLTEGTTKDVLAAVVRFGFPQEGPQEEVTVQLPVYSGHASEAEVADVLKKGGSLEVTIELIHGPRDTGAQKEGRKARFRECAERDPTFSQRFVALLIEAQKSVDQKSLESGQPSANLPAEGGSGV